MKFLCDRCKTRYSIGDERVRGKILKIRCKNCANVITVREGMPDADAPDAGAEPRRNRTTTQAPAADVSLNVNTRGTGSVSVVMPSAPEAVPAPANGRGNALGAAFASAMQKPPPALEEEWYVSIDGDQAGPYTLAEAQRWVASRSFDAELHCWSEGFDDWLPVDKVSHFRGLRKKPAPPAAPPPLPRLGGRAVTAARPVVEDEPKPLFAATMASLEKSAGTAVPAATSAGASGGLGSAAKRTTTGPVGNPSPTNPQPAMMHGHTNGAVTRGGAAANLAIAPAPQPIPVSMPQPARPTVPASKALARTAPTAQGIGALKSFDQSELGDSATQIETAPFQDEPATTAEPVASRVAAAAPMVARNAEPASRPNDPGRSAPVAARAAFADALGGPALRPAPVTDDDDDSDIDIGEVSRVVKLADIARPAPKPHNRTGSVARIPMPAGGSNPMLGRTSASVPKIIGGTVPVALVDAVEVVPGTNPNPIAPMAVVPDAVTPTHRRGLVVLLIGAALFVGIMVVVFAMMFGGKRIEEDTGLGGEYRVDNSRPDQQPVRVPGEPARLNPANPLEPLTNPNPFVPKRPVIPNKPQIKPPITPPEPPPGNSLKADEIEAMASKYSGTTTSCFRRADKGVDAILLSDVKRITVTLEVAPEGVVNTVTLSNNGSDKLGKCLTAMIRSWKFRASGGGTYRFVLAKPD